VALEGGPQPCGVVHPPSPEGWLPGEVQAIPRIYSWSKNTRTLENLEWFGPPERNTLRLVWWFVFPQVLFDVLEGSLFALI